MPAHLDRIQGRLFSFEAAFWLWALLAGPLMSGEWGPVWYLWAIMVVISLGMALTRSRSLRIAFTGGAWLGPARIHRKHRTDASGDAGWVSHPARFKRVSRTAGNQNKPPTPIRCPVYAQLRFPSRPFAIAKLDIPHRDQIAPGEDQGHIGA